MPTHRPEPSQTISLADPLDDLAVARVLGALEHAPAPAHLTVDFSRVRRIDAEALRRLALLVRLYPATRVGVSGLTIHLAGQFLRVATDQGFV